MRTTSRLILFIVTACIVALFYVPLGHDDYKGTWGDGTFGLVMPRNADPHVKRVVPGSPAAIAGVRAGDAIAGHAPVALVTGLAYPRLGERRTFTMRRPDGSRYVVHAVAIPVPGFNAWSRLSGILGILPATVFLVIAFMLVFLRPSVMTWAFYAYAAGYFSTGPTFQYYSHVLQGGAYAVLSFFVSTLFGSFAVMPLLPFVARFPNNELTGWRAGADRIVWAVMALSFLGYSYESFELWHGYRVAYSGFLDTWLPLAVFAAAALIVMKKYKHAPVEQRQRVGFLVAGLVVSFIAYAVYFVPGVSTETAQIIGYAVVLMPICVVYAVLRHRVLDINFVLNRAIAYGVLSLLVIAFISLLDWSLSRIVSEERLATGIELLVTIGIGFLLDRINRVIESFVESVLFRGRRIAEQYMRRAAAALPYATEESAISEGLTQIPADGLKLSAAALYRRSIDGTRFEGIATSNNTPIAPSVFTRNHLLVRILESSEERVWLDEVRTHLDADSAAIYVLAIPVNVRHELAAFSLYGAHSNGAQLDPEEIELLEELAREASRSYDHVEAVRMRERFDAIATAT